MAHEVFLSATDREIIIGRWRQFFTEYRRQYGLDTATADILAFIEAMEEFFNGPEFRAAVKAASSTTMKRDWPRDDLLNLTKDVVAALAIRTPSTPVPTAPVLSIDNQTDTTVVLSWTAIEDATSYVLRRGNASNDYNVEQDVGNVLTSTDTNVTAPYEKYYMVTAKFPDGSEGEHSNEVVAYRDED